MGLKWQQHKAKKAQDWVRQEMKLHGNSAKDFSLALTTIQSDEEMHALIYQSILSKYAIYHPKSGRPAKTTVLIKEEIRKLVDEDVVFSFNTYDNRHNELARSYDYLVKNSGLISFLAKVYYLFDEQGMLEVTRMLANEAYNFVDYLEDLEATDRTSDQDKFFSFLEKFKSIHPDYTNHPAEHWIKTEERKEK